MTIYLLSLLLGLPIGCQLKHVYLKSPHPSQPLTFMWFKRTADPMDYHVPSSKVCEQLQLHDHLWLDTIHSKLHFNGCILCKCGPGRSVKGRRYYFGMLSPCTHYPCTSASNQTSNSCKGFCVYGKGSFLMRRVGKRDEASTGADNPSAMEKRERDIQTNTLPLNCMRLYAPILTPVYLAYLPPPKWPFVTRAS